MSSIYPNIFKKLQNSVSFNAYFILHAHILNPLWYSRQRRGNIRKQVFEKALFKFCKAYRPYVLKLNPAPQKVSEEPERLFTIWLQGEEKAPALVKACFRSMRKHSDLPLIILDEKSIFDWISLPDYIIKKWKAGNISSAHFTDICRVELLYEHGGVWADSTDFFTMPVPDYIMNEDFFVFHAGNIFSYSFIQNCFIRAKKGNPLLKVWRDLIFKYWESENKIHTYFAHQMLFRFAIENNPIARQLYLKMPKIDQDPTHSLWFGHKNHPYSPETYDKWSKESFFTKTSYKEIEAINPLSGTVAEKIIKG